VDKQLITHSRIQCFQSCSKKHWWSYEMGLRKETTATAMRMGTNYHEMLDILGQGEPLLNATVWLADEYRQNSPPNLDEYQCSIEEATLATLITCYQWRWAESEIEILACEKSFRIPLRNPATGKPSTKFDHAGKIDKSIRLEDGRQGIMEHKLLGVPHDADSDLNKMRRMDPQVTLYLHAERVLGQPAETIIHDITRKPTIKPSPIPEIDEHGLKIVVDAQGNRAFTASKGHPRQTASKADGLVMKTRPMTPAEWSEKLRTDIGERPDFYFSRTEVPRLDSEIEEGLQDLWDAQKSIAEAQRTGRWFRHVDRNSCPWCECFSLCCAKYDLDSMGVPDGFVQSGVVHPEL